MRREVGIAFDFAAAERVPNTFLAHRAVALAAREGCADAAVEACFTAYFGRGMDIGAAAVLVPLLVAEAGLTGAHEPALLRKLFAAARDQAG